MAVATPHHFFVSGVLGAPAQDGVSITPSDSVDLPFSARFFSAGTDGNVVLQTLAGTQLTIVVKAGQVYPISAKRVLSTGTTSTGLIAWF